MTIDELKSYVEKECYRLLTEFSDYAENCYFTDPLDWKIEVYDHGGDTRYLGWCDVRNQIIRISSIFACGLSKAELDDTIAHEVAHGLIGVKRGRDGREIAHGKEWRELAKLMGGTGRAKTTLSSDDMEALQKHSTRTKLVIVYVDPNGEMKFVRDAKRRVKDLDMHFLYSDKKNSYGRLYHMSSDDWYNGVRCETKLFR